MSRYLCSFFYFFTVCFLKFIYSSYFAHFTLEYNHSFATPSFSDFEHIKYERSGIIKKAVSFIISIFIFLTPAFALSADTLIPIGHTTGIKMHADGIVVLGTSDIETSTGTINPANTAGICEGDIITKINGEKICESHDFHDKIVNSKASEITLTVLREGKEQDIKVTPAQNKSGEKKIGIWIRDSMAGIGTITFYDPESKTFGALGHGICDTQSNVLIPLKEGSVMESTVIDVKRGEVGTPGELEGEYNSKEDYGVIFSNTNSGIFGTVLNNLDIFNSKEFPVAKSSEIKEGPAVILSNIEGDNVSEYSIEILKIYPDSEKDTKNMLIKITDKNLISKTGGIVQGMSGSPIIQNGKLIGAVTHVLVNDPCRGYGIFIENMLEKAG